MKVTPRDFISWLERNSYRDYAFHDGSLPEYPPNPWVNIPIEKIRRFNSDQKSLLAFAAFVLDCDVEQVTNGHLMFYVMNRINERSDTGA